MHIDIRCNKHTQIFDTIRFKPRTELISCYAVHVIFTLVSFFCVWAKNLTYISQLTPNSKISCCESHSQLCPLKTAKAETSCELYRFR